MNVDQGGTSLPERDYYLKDDPKNKETREQYVAHMTKMFSWPAMRRDAAATEAQAVLALETQAGAGAARSRRPARPEEPRQPEAPLTR